MISNSNRRVIDESLEALNDGNTELAMRLSTMILVRACIMQNVHEKMSEVSDEGEPWGMSIAIAWQ
jgi:hypothetical protein